MNYDIEKIKEEADKLIKKLLYCMESNDSLIRADSIEILESFFYPSVQHKLIKSLDDINEIVQINAIEALTSLGNKNYIDLIRDKLNSKSWLVRAYAIESLGNFYDIESKQILLEKIPNAYEEELPRLYFALIKLGEESFYTPLFHCLNHKNYRIRIASSNMLYYLVNKNNKSNVLQHIKNQILIEDKESVISALNGTINDINNLTFS